MKEFKGLSSALETWKFPYMLRAIITACDKYDRGRFQQPWTPYIITKVESN